jgi:hypothetical protein
MTKRFSTQSHRIGNITFPNDSWGIGPVRVVKASPSVIASGKAASAPLEELVKETADLSRSEVVEILPFKGEERRRQEALNIIEKVKSSEARLDLHYSSATLKLRYAIAKIEDLGGYQLFGHKNFNSFWEEFFPGCGSRQRATLQSGVCTVLRLLNLPLTGDELPTTSALQRLTGLGVRDVVAVRDERGRVVANYQVCQLDRANLVKKAWSRALELSDGGIPTEKQTLQAVRELARKNPRLRSPKDRNPFFEQVKDLTAQLKKAEAKIKVLEQINQELREHLARQEEGSHEQNGTSK